MIDHPNDAIIARQRMHSSIIRTALSMQPLLGVTNEDPTWEHIPRRKQSPPRCKRQKPPLSRIAIVHMLVKIITVPPDFALRAVQPDSRIIISRSIAFWGKSPKSPLITDGSEKLLNIVNYFKTTRSVMCVCVNGKGGCGVVGNILWSLIQYSNTNERLHSFSLYFSC